MAKKKLGAPKSQKKLKRVNGNSLQNKTPKPVAKKLERRHVVHLVLAPQHPEGIAEFKAPLHEFRAETYGVLLTDEADRASANVLVGLMKTAGKDVYLLHLDPLHNILDIISKWPHDCVIVAKGAEPLRDIGLNLVDGLPQCGQVQTAALSDDANMLIITLSEYTDKSRTAEVASSAILVNLIVPGEPSLSRALRYVRKMETKPIKPAREWHATGERPPLPSRGQHRERQVE